MAATIVADHLESLLLEIDYASRGIASHAGMKQFQARERFDSATSAQAPQKLSISG